MFSESNLRRLFGRDYISAVTPDIPTFIVNAFLELCKLLLRITRSLLKKAKKYCKSETNLNIHDFYDQFARDDARFIDIWNFVLNQSNLQHIFTEPNTFPSFVEILKALKSFLKMKIREVEDFLHVDKPILSENRLRRLIGASYISDVTCVPKSKMESYMARCVELENVTRPLISDVECFCDPEEFPNFKGSFKRLMKRSKYTKAMWKFATKCLNIANNDVFTNLRKLEAIRNLLSELHSFLVEKKCQLKEALKFEYADFGSLSEADNAELSRYVRVSHFLSTTTEVRTFVEQILDVCKDSRSLRHAPFGIICDSSGKGKTNTAFSLKIPYLYFTLNTSSSQDQKIHNCFVKQSLVFCEMLKRDYHRQLEEMKMENNKELGVEVDKLSESILEYEIVGFLVAIAKIVCDEYSKPENTDKFSVQFQTEIIRIAYQPMTFKMAIRELDMLVPLKHGHNYILPVFFDECVKLEECGIGDEEFLFLREVVSCMLCFPVFIGNDTKQLEFFDDPIWDCGGRIEEYNVWCLLWFRLPPLLSEILAEETQKLGEMVTEWRRLSSNNVFPSNEALQFIYKWLQKERPLFLNYAVDFVKIIIRGKVLVQSDTEFLNLLFCFIRDLFQKNSDAHSFNFSQLAYVFSFNWDTDVPIRDHLGQLLTSAFDKKRPFYARLTVLTETRLNSTRYVRILLPRKSGIFKSQSKFDSFSDAPLTGLVITGLESNANSMLKSVMNSIYSFSFDRHTEHVGHVEGKKCGNILELSLLAAVVRASRCGGFAGTNILDFLNAICFELDLNGCVQGQYPQLLKKYNVAKVFLDAFEDFKLPFASPMASEQWDPSFVEEISPFLGVREPFLGIAYPSVKHKAFADCALGRWDENTPILPKNVLPSEPLLIGQCKFYDGRLGAGKFKDIFKSYDKFKNCRLFFLVAPEFTTLNNLKHSEYHLWKIVPTISGLVLKELNNKQSENNNKESSTKKKHVVLFSLKQLYSGSETDYLEAINQLIIQK